MTCPECHCVFCVDNLDSPPDVQQNRKTYCTDECRQRAARRRARHQARKAARAEFFRKQALAARQGELCQMQGKQKYHSKSEARQSIRKINTESGIGLKHAYRCGDHWHLTTQR